MMALLSWICGSPVIVPEAAVRLIPGGSVALGLRCDCCCLTDWPSCSPGTSDAFIIRFVCNDDVYPGTPKFLHQDIASHLGIRNTFFEFETALACVPSPVDCQVTGTAGRARH